MSNMILQIETVFAISFALVIYFINFSCISVWNVFKVNLMISNIEEFLKTVEDYKRNIKA